jgi:hypothetical protein
MSELDPVRDAPKTAWERRLARFRKEQSEHAREMRLLALEDKAATEQEPFRDLMKKVGRA